MTAALDSFKNWAVKIVMTDFIDRDDQKAIQFLHHFADEAAKRELMVMIHGAPKPAGFSRTHPNVLTREAPVPNTMHGLNSSIPHTMYNLLL